MAAIRVSLQTYDGLLGLKASTALASFIFSKFIKIKGESF